MPKEIRAAQAAELAARIGDFSHVALSDDTRRLVVGFAIAIAEKLAESEAKYEFRDDWIKSDWMDECRADLLSHVHKGDPRDVAAYCAFLWHHGESTAPGGGKINHATECVDASVKADTARLDWLDKNEASLITHREQGFEEGEFSIWWNVVKDGKSISGHPLAYAREAIDEAMPDHPAPQPLHAQGEQEAMKQALRTIACDERACLSDKRELQFVRDLARKTLEKIK